MWRVLGLTAARAMLVTVTWMSLLAFEAYEVLRAGAGGTGGSGAGAVGVSDTCLSPWTHT